jgi:hypothetical protein
MGGPWGACSSGTARTCRRRTRSCPRSARGRRCRWRPAACRGSACMLAGPVLRCLPALLSGLRWRTLHRSLPRRPAGTPWQAGQHPSVPAPAANTPHFDSDYMVPTFQQTMQASAWQCTAGTFVQVHAGGAACRAALACAVTHALLHLHRGVLTSVHQPERPRQLLTQLACAAGARAAALAARHAGGRGACAHAARARRHGSLARARHPGPPPGGLCTCCSA